MTGWLPVLLAASAGAMAAARTGTGSLRLNAVSPMRGSGVPSLPACLALLATAVYAAAGTAAAVVAVLAVLVVHRTTHGRRQAAEAAKERRCALDALSLLGADLRSGRTPADALAAAADVAHAQTGAALAAAAAAARLGGDVAVALTAEPTAIPATLRALAACWQVCSEAGSGLAAAVEKLEEGLRAEEAQRRAVAAELAGPRATAQLLAALPLAGIGLAAALGAHPLHLLLGTPPGLGCLIAGLALDGMGVLWTHRLTADAHP